jgi:hypothetical protein
LGCRVEFVALLPEEDDFKGSEAGDTLPFCTACESPNDSGMVASDCGGFTSRSDARAAAPLGWDAEDLALKDAAGEVLKDAELESLLEATGGEGLLGFKMPGACFFKSGGDCFLSSSIGFSAKVTFLFSATGCDWVLECELADSTESERSRWDCCFFATRAGLGIVTTPAADNAAD